MNRCYPKPVIAAVNGAAMGGGFELVMASDLAVVADHVTFGVPEVKRGVVGAGCSPHRGARSAGDRVRDDADRRPDLRERALELGLVNAVVPADEVLDHAMALAERIAANAPIALRITKQIVWDAAGNRTNEEWATIRAKAAPAFASDDAR